jgi:hypothetical protein
MSHAIARAGRGFARAELANRQLRLDLPSAQAQRQDQVAATDESGQTATDEYTLRILVHGGGGVIALKEK